MYKGKGRLPAEVYCRDYNLDLHLRNDFPVLEIFAPYKSANNELDNIHCQVVSLCVDHLNSFSAKSDTAQENSSYEIE